MALVDYSDSDSEPETTVQPTPAPVAAAPTPKSAPAAGAKKPFQKVIDRSKPGKILVSLPQTTGRDESETGDGSDQPPAKRAKIGGSGGGAFSGFNSFLPPPKNTGKPTVTSSSSSSGKSAPTPGVNLKTGAAPGFSRDTDDHYDEVGAKVGGNANSKQQQQQQQQPSIPEGQKPADEVKLVGKPMMFKPLSVSRRPGAKKNANRVVPTSKTTAASPSSSSSATTTATAAKGAHTSIAPSTKETEPPKKKISLFSISDEPEDEGADNLADDGVYEPMFSNGDGYGDADDLTTEEAFAQYDAQYGSSSSLGAPQQHHQQWPTGPSGVGQADSLDAIASDMNLSAAARRELFGRRGAPDPAATAAKVINFNTDREYEHNEALRQSGEAQPAYNPVRAIAPGKHNLRQLVNQVHNQREALEESFAKGRSNKNEASARYGWR
ncbi:hypothetical protein SLS62_010606 [Diatrype stigma]|uniref:Mitotic checkpoint regulator, MAD2B-interacting-domain-containing protein n=1 Tax=Diatrype stigma TaxID=117547 RepID=A0AAN9UB43_9PEZI